MDQSIKPNSVAGVDEPQELENIQISQTQKGIQVHEQFEEEVESSSYETDIDKPIDEMRN